MRPVLDPAGVVIDRGLLAVLKPGFPLANLFAVVILAFDHRRAVRIVEPEEALLDGSAGAGLLAPDPLAVGRRLAHQGGAGRARRAAVASGDEPGGRDYEQRCGEAE